MTGVNFARVKVLLNKIVSTDEHLRNRKRLLLVDRFIDMPIMFD